MGNTQQTITLTQEKIKDVLSNTRIVTAVLFALGAVLFLLLFLDSHYKTLTDARNEYILKGGGAN
jgi:hypothetical protein